jgi:hypothetical protein
MYSWGVRHAAGHAATEQKKWGKLAGDARSDAAEQQTLQTPEDDDAFNKGLKVAEDVIRADTTITDFGPEHTAHMLFKKKSEMWANRAMMLSNNNQEAGAAMLQRMKTDQVVDPRDYEKAEKYIQNQVHTVVSRNISEAVNGGFAPYMGQSEIIRAQGVDSSLVEVFKQAQRDNPDLRMTIGGQGGKRTLEEQKGIFAQGRTTPGKIVTWTLDSDHVKGRALDVVPKDKSTTQEQITAAMQAASEKLGIPLAVDEALKAKDPDHYALPKEYDSTKFQRPADETSASKQQRAREYVRTQYQDDPKMIYSVGDRVRADNDRQIVEQHKEEQQRFLRVADYVYGVGPDGQKITNQDQLVNNPVMFGIYQGMEEPGRRRIDNIIKANAKEPTAETAEKAVATQKVLDMSTELSGRREAFMKIDPAELLDKGIVSTSGMKTIAAKQREILNNQAKDNHRLSTAMRLSHNYLKANNIISGSEEEASFMGAMNQWLQEPEREKKAPRTDQEILDKAKQLTETYGATSLGLFSIGGRFGFVPPKEFINDITPKFKTDPRNVTKRDPKPEELSRFWEYSQSHPNWRKELGYE